MSEPIARVRRTGVRERSSPYVWSPLEHARHVRDVHRVLAACAANGALMPASMRHVIEEVADRVGAGMRVLEIRHQAGTRDTESWLEVSAFRP